MTDQNPAEHTMPVFRMQKMYLKDFSFESPNAPQVFLAQKQEPHVDFNLQVKHQQLNEDHWEVSLHVSAKVQDKANADSILFIIEIEHAAVFLLRNIPEEHHKRVIEVECPLMIFPFTRQLVSQVSVDGGFNPFLMEPINFLGLFENAKQQNKDA